MTPLPPELEALMPEPSYRITSKMGEFICLRSKSYDNKKGDTLFTADQVRQAMLDATERAAKVCDVLAVQLSAQWRQGHKQDAHLEGQSDGAFDCADAIRGDGND